MCRDADDSPLVLPDPDCETCHGRGEVGFFAGSPAHGDWYCGTDPCPDCVEPKLRALADAAAKAP